MNLKKKKNWLEFRAQLLPHCEKKVLSKMH